MSIAIIYVTHASQKEAQQFVDTLLEEKLIACANIMPISSAYWWQGNIQHEGEWVSIVKTLPSHWEKLQQKAEAIHPYEVPCIWKLEVETIPAYQEWIAGELA